jgi:hypothetical protein
MASLHQELSEGLLMVNQLPALPTLPTIERSGRLESVVSFEGAMPTGVTVSQQGRIFINFPKWGDDVQCSVAEIRNGRPEAYPNDAFNRTEDLDLVGSLVSVQSVVVDLIDQIKTDGKPFDTQKIHTTI